MCYEKGECDIYKDTIDSSKEMSLQKAIAIFMEEQEKTEPLIKRPDINLKSGIIKILAVVILLSGLCVLFSLFNISVIYVILLALFIVSIKAKQIIIWSILVYQKCAPERIRKSCVFEPSCSNYMLISINKFGLIKGTIKGIKRLIRCHPPNGGIDNP